MTVPNALPAEDPISTARSEEHTSELQSQSNLVCRLLLEKKKHILINVSGPLDSRAARGRPPSTFGLAKTTAPTALRPFQPPDSAGSVSLSSCISRQQPTH